MSTQTISSYVAVRKEERSDFSALEVGTFISILIASIFLLSIFFFSNQSIRLDEAQSLWQTSHSIKAMLVIIAEDVHVPFYHIILHYWQVVFGGNLESARMLSLIFFGAMIVGIYALAKKAFGTGIGLFAAMLAALSPFLNWYGNEVRMYTIFGFLIILNQYFFIQTFDRAEGVVPKSVWAGYAITLVIGLFTHYFFVLSIISQAIFYIFYRASFPRNALRNFLAILAIAAICFAPWIFFVFNLGSASNTQPLLSQPSSVDLFNTFFQFLYGFQSDTTNTIIISLWPLLVLFIFLFLRRHQSIPPQAVYFLLSVLVPIVLTFTISAIFKPIYLSRYLILTLPSLFILVSWAISTYRERISRMLKIGLVLSIGIMLISQIANAHISVKEDYRSASQYLREKATPKDIIVVSAPFTIYPFEYYYQGPAEVRTLPIWNRYEAGAIPAFTDDGLVTDAQALTGSHQYLWLLLSYDQGYEETIKQYFDTRYERVEAREFSPGINLYGYKLRYDQEEVQKALREPL